MREPLASAPNDGTMPGMHTVAILALHDVVVSDLALPSDLLGELRLPDGEPAYAVRVAGVAKVVRSERLDLCTRFGLDALARADTIVVPGIRDVGAEIPKEVCQALRAAFDRGARIASICSGAFVIAAAGLLDHRRATTHWMAAGELARRYPTIRVEPDVLYVDEGRVLSSAGAAAGLDLCLHLIRLDHGAALAAEAARIAVMPLERDGRAAQRVVPAGPGPEGPSLEPVLRWIESALATPLTLALIARRAGMSVRTLSRRFREQTGTTPVEWLTVARVRRAQLLLETTGRSVEAIASEVGLASATSLRVHFQRHVGKSPQAHRRSFAPKTATAG